ncbi:type VI secretion system baseplate subunit TssF [uncultured Shewanella sp.]|uniref:type VI secretion system baseplate subunit TssF n=1 Tax=uncultured Shewanella sp. TaxID=173975 RepID=UPI00260F4A3F|nr:type VI secretion system baseplate subunit TssF [uncultured Shewanella sp.]
MELNSELQTAYSDEIAYINDFRHFYTERFIDAPIGENNPEIKKLVESIALLLARNRVTGEKHIAQLYNRLFYQLYPYLVSPLPSMSLIKVNQQNLAESLVLTRDTAMILSTNDGEEAIFKTLFDQKIQPVKLDNIECFGGKVNQSTLKITVSNLSEIPHCLDGMNLFLRVGDDLISTLKLQQLLSDSSISVHAVFDGGKRVDCQYFVGRPKSCQLQSSGSFSDINPVALARYYFHMPLQASYFNIDLIEAPQRWQTCTFEIVLDCSWPESLRLTKDMFQLNVIAVENRLPDEAKPIECDGIQSSYPIMPPSDKPDMELSQIEGVYLIEDNQRIALQTGVIKNQPGNYEIHLNSVNGRRLPALSLNMPQSFEEPVQIVVQALWHQPAFKQQLWKDISVRFYDMDCPELSLQLLPNIQQKIVPYQDPVELTPEQYLSLSALKNKAKLEVGDIILMLDSLSSVWAGDYKVIRSLINTIHARESTFILDSGRACKGLEYVLSLHHVDHYLEPLVIDFNRRLAHLLTHWISAIPIKIKCDYQM